LVSERGTAPIPKIDFPGKPLPALVGGGFLFFVVGCAKRKARELIALFIGIAVWLSWCGRGTAEQIDLQQLYEDGLKGLQERQMYRAERSFQQILERDSTFYDAYIQLARMYKGKRELDRVEKLLRAAVRQDSDRVEAHFELSQILHGKGKSAEAYARLQKVLELEPDTPAAYVGIGSMRMKPDQMMDLTEAEEAFEKVLDLEPDNYQAAFDLGKVLMYQGKWEQARGAFERILEGKPDNLSAFYQLGILHFREGNDQKAVEDLQKGLGASPNNPIVRWALKLVYKRLGGYPAGLDSSFRFTASPREEIADLGIELVDVAPQMGVNRRDLGRGSSWADYDGDGDLDLFTSGHFSGTALYRNDGASFSDRTREAGVAGDAGMGSLFADYDNDGDPDLYVVRDGWYGKKGNSLFRNEGNGRFADVTGRAGVEDPGSSFTASWGDMDGDGNLDLVVANGVPGDGSPNRLFRGDGEGRFADVAEEAGIGSGRSIGCTLGDYDNDGDLDLYFARFNQLNSFYRNDTEPESGRMVFTDVTRETRTQLPAGGYFTFFFDYDLDGNLDLFCSELSDYVAVLYSKEEGRTRLNRNRPALYHNAGDGSFTDATYAAGLGRSYGATGAHFGDFNGDGYPDIYLATGGEEMTRYEPDALLLNVEGKRFVDVAEQIGIEQLGKGHGVTFADFDGDGDQDIYVPIGGTFPGDAWENRLYRNDRPPRSWLTLHLVGTDGNRDGIGARVRVRAGEREFHATMGSGGGFGSGNSGQLEMGLGDAAGVEELEVRWPSGRVDVWRDVDVDRHLVLYEGGKRETGSEK